jgi:hypothetical protein
MPWFVFLHLLVGPPANIIEEQHHPRLKILQGTILHSNFLHSCCFCIEFRLSDIYLGTPPRRPAKHVLLGNGPATRRTIQMHARTRSL